MESCTDSREIQEPSPPYTADALKDSRDESGGNQEKEADFIYLFTSFIF